LQSRKKGVNWRGETGKHPGEEIEKPGRLRRRGVGNVHRSTEKRIKRGRKKGRGGKRKKGEVKLHLVTSVQREEERRAQVQWKRSIGGPASERKGKKCLALRGKEKTVGSVS